MEETLMRKFYILIIILSFLTVLNFSVFAQYKESNRLRAGGGIGAFLSSTGDSAKPAIQYRLFFRHDLARMVQGEFGIGVGSLDTGGSKTRLLPIFDYRLLLQFYTSESWYPYLYFGGGFLYYSIQESKSDSLQNLRASKWNAFFPAGLGVDIRLDETLAFGLSGGYNLTFTDDLDGVRTGDNDGYWSALATLSVGGGFGEPDPDRDGLSTKLEKSIGTNPKNKDTDGEGLSDGEEYNYYLTNPLQADTDGDGLDDSEEIITHSTNPTRRDSDADQLSDWDEIKTHGTNANNPDSDFDGLNDFQEILTYKSDPWNPDMDNDQLKDGDEVKYKTDIFIPDTDTEGLLDGDEVLNHKTNPLKVDTDGGTVNDFTEVNRGTNPLDPTDDVILEVKEVGAAIVLDDVNFATNSADIRPESETVLGHALNTFNAYPDMIVEISGYTDNTGSYAYNMQLSQRRADSVRNWLIQKGVNENRINSKGYGPDNPIAPNNTREGRAKNRRIEFVRLK